jgi:hypothetical protein
MANITQYQLTPVLPKLISKEDIKKPPNTTDNKLNILVKHFENNNNNDNKHKEFLNFILSKELPDEVLNILYNDIISKTNNSIDLQRQRKLADELKRSSVKEIEKIENENTVPIIDARKKKTIILNYVSKTYRNKADALFDLIYPYFYDNEEDLGYILDILSSEKKKISLKFARLFIKIKNLSAVKQIIGTQRFSYLDNHIKELNHQSNNTLTSANTTTASHDNYAHDDDNEEDEYNDAESWIFEK